MGSLPFVPMAGAAGSSQAQTSWWDSSYQFRRPLTVANGGSTPFVNQTVVVHLNFTGNEVQDPVADIRLVDLTGAQVPSAIASPQYSGDFLRSAYLVFLSNLQPRASSLYYVYTGASFQTVPSYRPSSSANSIGSGIVTLSQVPLSLDSTQVRLSFGTLDSETTMSKVTYSAKSGPVGYGPSSFSQNPFSNDSGLIQAARLNPQTTVAYDSMQAGSLQFTRILVGTPRSALVIDAVANIGPTAAPNVGLTTVLGLAGLSALGQSSSVYTQGTGLLYTQNPDAYFGVRLGIGPSSYTLGTSKSVLAQASTGTFAGISTYQLASAAGFAWNLGSIVPGGAVWVSSAWGVALSASQIGAGLPALPIRCVTGQVEVQGVATPRASSLWSAGVTLTNLVVPPGGVVIPFATGGADLIPGISSATGTYLYSVPPSPQVNSGAWTSAASSSGNGTAFVSPQYFSFDKGVNVIRLEGTIPNTVSTTFASVISDPGFGFKGGNVGFEVKYRVSYTVAAGSLSGQDLFIAADFDPTLTGNYSKSIVLPASGTSTTLPASGCAVSGTPAPKLVQVVPSGLLIGDNTWRSLSIPLPSSLPAGGFNVRLRMCLATASGFSGQVDLEVLSAGVVVTGPVTNIIQTTFSHKPTALTISYLPQSMLIGTVGTTANLTISLRLQMNSSVGWKDGSTFSGVVRAPLGFAMNTSGIARSISLMQPRFAGVLVQSAVSDLVESGQIAGTSAAVLAGDGLSMVGLGMTSVPGGSTFDMGLRPEPVYVKVLDQNGVGVPGVQVVPGVDSRIVPVTSVTNGSGVAKLVLIPWTFDLNATFEGVGVGSASLAAASQPELVINSKLYHLTLAVRDSRGGALAGAQIALSLNSYNFSGTTNSRGSYSFEAVANALYSVSISVGSISYFNGQISATANNAVVQITTTYYPESAQLLVAALIAMVPVVVIVGYFVARRLRRSR